WLSLDVARVCNPCLAPGHGVRNPCHELASLPIAPIPGWNTPGRSLRRGTMPPYMPRRPRLYSVNRFADIVAAGSLLLLLLILVLWGLSYHGSVQFHLPGPDRAALDFCSHDGQLMFGVF